MSTVSVKYTVGAVSIEYIYSRESEEFFTVRSVGKITETSMIQKEHIPNTVKTAIDILLTEEND